MSWSRVAGRERERVCVCMCVREGVCLLDRVCVGRGVWGVCGVCVGCMCVFCWFI